MRVGTKRREDARDIGTLQGVSYLHAKEAETEIPQFPKRQIRFLFHNYILFSCTSYY